MHSTRGRFMQIRYLLILFLITASTAIWAQTEAFRAPSYPLITHDPYFSIWMNNEVPTNAEAAHWTQTNMPIRSMIRIDGKPYRLMGKSPVYVDAAQHIGTILTATQTTFVFQQDNIEIKLKFLSPLLVDDLDLVSRPLSYVSWNLKSLDGKKHDVEIYFDISGYACIDRSGQEVTWEKLERHELELLKIGTQKQRVLGKSGDDVRIDWGYLYVGTSKKDAKETYIGRSEEAMDAFVNAANFPADNKNDQKLKFRNYQPVLAVTYKLDVPEKGDAETMLMVAYDDVYSVEYFGKKLEGYWKLKFNSMELLLEAGKEEYAEISERCDSFDEKLKNKATELGGEKYAVICNLAHRQCMAAHKIVRDEKNEPLCFSKENDSNGSMATVDVFYPASPYFLYLNTELLKAQTTPIFEYAESGRWPWPYAPHDIGLYPIGNGQRYGGGEESEDNQMPVEECGNMLILAAAIAKVEGNALYAKKYWDIITNWAEYLKSNGFDLGSQLSTDDFSGHLEYNANLSVKAILGIESYATLCEMQGLNSLAAEYHEQAEDMVEKWLHAAADANHYRLAFDKPGSWSQKYNMIWDQVLAYNLFPPEVVEKEISFYLKQQNRYGLPLDSRSTYAKLDWILWTASMAGSNEDFKSLVSPVYSYLNETPNRVPMSDFYWTKSAERRSYTARSVVGAVYMEFLKDKLK
ncbi:MAG: DUF4965 domain-containing protein [Puniceicoccaceae bacterium]